MRHGSYGFPRSLDRRGKQGSSDSFHDAGHGAARGAGKDNAAARRYAGVKSPVVQTRPRGSAGQAPSPAPSPVIDDRAAQDAAEPASAKTQDVIVEAGELLKVDISAQERIELVILSQESGVVFQGRAASRQVTYRAPGKERVRIQTLRPPADCPLARGPLPA